MQYSLGTVTFTQGSPYVVGSGTLWTVDTVKEGQQIHHADFPYIAYTIGDIDYNTQIITLTSNYAKVTDAGANYVVVSEYTPNLNLPELSAGDLHAAAILTRGLRTIDQVYATLAAVSTFHISDTPPEDTTLIWLDTSEL